MIAAIVLGFSTIHGFGCVAAGHTGLIAAIGASLMWGTMYVPYRKAYISGMNPLSFVTVFTVGELGTMFALTLFLDGGRKSSVFQLVHSQSLLFWLFLGGFVWVIGAYFSNSPRNIWGSDGAFPCQIQISFGGLPGALWSSGNWPRRIHNTRCWSCLDQC